MSVSQGVVGPTCLTFSLTRSSLKDFSEKQGWTKHFITGICICTYNKIINTSINYAVQINIYMLISLTQVDGYDTLRVIKKICND